jgi:hypothetical protein
MLPKFTEPYFVKENFYTHTTNTIRYLDTYYFIFDEQIRGHRCFFSATSNKIRAHMIFRLGISSNIDPLGRFMHGEKPAVKKKFHMHKVATTM